jgi:hypothetical protein
MFLLYKSNTIRRVSVSVIEDIEDHKSASYKHVRHVSLFSVDVTVTRPEGEDVVDDDDDDDDDDDGGGGGGHKFMIDL